MDKKTCIDKSVLAYMRYNAYIPALFCFPVGVTTGGAIYLSACLTQHLVMVACSGASTVLIAFVTLMLSRLGHAGSSKLLQNLKLTTDCVGTVLATM